MNHLPGFFVIAICALVVVRIIVRPLTSTGKLEEAARLNDLLPRLLPYAYHGDRARLMAAIGGVSGLRSMRRSCRAISILISRQARADGGSSRLAQQTFLYSIASSWVILGAIVETWIRALIPLWPPVLLIVAAQIYCEMAVTYEALLEMV